MPCAGRGSQGGHKRPEGPVQAACFHVLQQVGVKGKWRPGRVPYRLNFAILPSPYRANGR